MRSLRTFARLCLGEAIPDETTILNFCHLLEASELTEYILKLGNAPLARKGPLIKKGSNVDATIIAALRTSKNKTNVRAHEMPQTKRGIQWHFGIKEDIAVEAESGLVYTVTTVPANDADESRSPTCCTAKMNRSGPTRTTGAWSSG